MPVSAYWYGQGLLKAMNKEIDWDSDTIKVMLSTSGYTPNQDTHVHKSDVTNEVVGAGYSAGGATLAGKTITYDAGTNITKFDADDAVWSPATITARYAVIYGATPALPADQPLLGYIDFGGDYISTDGEFRIAWHADGILKLTAS